MFHQPKNPSQVQAFSWQNFVNVDAPVSVSILQSNGYGRYPGVAEGVLRVWCCGWSRGRDWLTQTFGQGLEVGLFRARLKTKVIWFQSHFTVVSYVRIKVRCCVVCMHNVIKEVFGRLHHYARFSKKSNACSSSCHVCPSRSNKLSKKWNLHVTIYRIRLWLIHLFINILFKLSL